eukprot:CAMPEP_0181169556 /NCGR_PEP_ID=MMETSP1096-20121128/879_1 /TAXON_ID=156174 ORGANISM="Chrysochromulina ericina, Strain CCMP281" /NCGR_SAMPLE_ID=MMETSP1096 /ASSEMBLY_ACC=CAM_ASM_000453 /LENGTH=211 /DNA_ID=CAMNT_0023257025 /DNA_START=45 /DNA_END=680 /DNA_ORIENTATION=+
MGTITYFGYSMLHSTKASMYVFFMLAGLGTMGSTFSASSVTPFFSNLGNKSNMGRIMSINSMCSSGGRVLGPPLFGILYSINIHFPYRVAALCTAVASSVYFLVYTIATPKKDRPSTALAEKDSAKLKLNKHMDIEALAKLTEALREIITERGYDLSNPTVVDLIKEIMTTSLPPRTEGQSDEDVLREEAHHLHDHWDAMHKESAHYHPHT